MKPVGYLPFILFSFWLLLIVLKKRKALQEEKRRARKAFLEDSKVGLSLKKKDYLIDQRGIERSNPIERKFKRRFLFELLETFHHQCASCHKGDVKLTLDHFFIPKSQGGNLMVKSKRGYWVCNALPMCRKCNQRKRDLPAEQFFQPEKLHELKLKMVELSWLINDFYRDDE